MSAFAKSVFEYQVTRSNRRKTLSVVIRHAKVKVMVPDFVSDAQVNSFVNERHEWIVEKLNLQQQYVAQKQQFEKQYTEGETFLYFGNEIYLHLVSAGRSWVDLHGLQLVVAVSDKVAQSKRNDTIKRLITNWYKKQLTLYVSPKMHEQAMLMGVDFKELKVRSYKRRWGSCTAQGVVSFNLLLAMAPKFVIDYVILHELCHRVHMNHSSDFWALVATYCPDYKLAKVWLKDHSELLQL